MHRNEILILFVIILNATTIFSSPASLLDLIWDDSEPEKRDDSSNMAQKSCLCNGPSCICCVDFNITFIDLGGPGCVRMKYLSQEEGIAVNVSYGDSLLHSEQVKAGPNPKPACMSILSNIAQVCATFSNFRPVNDGLKGCLSLAPKLLGDVQTQFDVGCFDMGPSGIKMDTTSNFTSANDNKNEIEEALDFNEEELFATVNETAEQGLAFLGSWLGFFDKPDKANATVGSPDKQNTPPPASRKSRSFLDQNHV